MKILKNNYENFSQHKRLTLFFSLSQDCLTFLLCRLLAIYRCHISEQRGISYSRNLVFKEFEILLKSKRKLEIGTWAVSDFLGKVRQCLRWTYFLRYDRNVWWYITTPLKLPIPRFMIFNGCTFLHIDGTTLVRTPLRTSSIPWLSYFFFHI